MSSFFEQELYRLFGDGQIIQDPKFVSRACLGDLGGDLRVRVEFISMNISNQYNALRLTVLNRTEGTVDKTILRFQDVLGVKQIPGNPNFPKGISPHIWGDCGKVSWYAFRPTAADYQALRRAAGDYMDIFRERLPDIPVKAAHEQANVVPRSKRGRER